MESKKINQLATAVSPSTSDLAIIGDPVTGVSKKITWLQVSTLIGTAANLQQVTDNGATTTNPVTIGGLTITGLSTGVLKSDSGVISSVPFGAANGVATLAGDGKVPSNQLPSYVDDVVEVANYAALPVTGETGKIYITLDNNKVYRWGGSVYVEIAANQAVWGSITGTLANQTDLQNALNAKVPTSRTITINGTSYDLSADRTWSVGTLTSVGLTMPSGFSVTSSPLTGAGGTIAVTGAGASTQYIDGTGALQTFPTLLSSDNLVKLVRNQSGATMTAGTIVYISGATGNKPLIAKALATGDATSAQTYGLLQADIANNADGYVVVVGNVGSLDTSALTEGQQLYLSGTTAGAYTTTKPYAPTHLVYVGIVLRSHPVSGIIGVKIQNGYEMDELHNVDAYAPSNNDILSYNTTTSLWEHKQIATTLGFTPISLASLSATSPLSYNNGTGAFSIQVATASQNGYLSSTDLSTFNNKQAALGGTGFVKITGSTISYDNSTYYLASNPSGYITLASLSAGAGISYSNITGVISSTITQYTDALARAAFSESVVGLDYNSTTGVLSTTTGYAIPTTAKQAEWDSAYSNRISSLTTTGSSGAATLIANTLNVPNYTLSGLGGQPLDADLTAIAALAGTSGFLKKTAADTWALDTNTYLTGNQTITLSGDVSGSGATAITTTIGAGKVTNAMLAGSIDLTTKVTGLLPDGNIASAATWNAKQAAITLTTTGTSGAATFISNTLNIPNYTYTLPTASTSVLGGVKVDGTTITINGSGVISGANTYSLPIATSSILGGVKIGSGVSVDVNGVISVSTNYQAPLNGTGFVKATGTTISYDNSTYLTTASAASTYQTIITNPVTGTGVSGYVAFFNSTSSIAGESNLLWDASNNRLQVGSVSSTYSITALDGLQIGDGSGSAINFNSNSGYKAYIRVAGNDRITIDSTSGRVGIGTNNINASLEVKSTTANEGSLRLYNTINNAATTWGLEWFRDYDSGSNSDAGYIKYKREGGTAGSLIFGAGSFGSISTALTINSSRNVAIGTDTATAKLQISNTSAGAASVAAFLVNESATANTEVRLAFAAHTNVDIATNRYAYISALNTSNSNGQALIFATNTSGNSAVQRLRIAADGKIGINCDPTFRFQVEESISTAYTGNNIDTYSNAYIRNTSTTAGVAAILSFNAEGAGNSGVASIGVVNTASGSGAFFIGTRNASGTTDERVRVASNGFVGINNSSPFARLTIDSNIGSARAFSSSEIPNIFLRDTTTSAINVGGAITFAGYKSATGNTGLFAIISGQKENGTDGNELGAFVVYTSYTSGGAFRESFRIKSDGVINSGANYGGGGNRVIYTDNTGNFIAASVGTGLSLSGGVLSATGGASGTISGSGNSGYIPKFTGTASIGNSQLYDDGTSIILGSTSASSGFKVTAWAASASNTTAIGSWPYWDTGTQTMTRKIMSFNDGGNGGTSTAGTGTTAYIEIGQYYTGRGVITMSGSGGASPSDQGMGRGKDLMVIAGSSDNGTGYLGGRLYLQGGSGYSGGYNTNFGDVIMSQLGGNVSVGYAAPSYKLDVNGDIRAGGNFRATSSGSGLYFSGGTNRIYFSTYRGMEGATDGSLLQIGEGFSLTTIYNNLSINASSVDKPNLTLNGLNYPIIKMGDRTSGTTDIGYFHIYDTNNIRIDLNAETSAFSFFNAGNVVIGSSTQISSGYKFQVSGAIYASGDVIAFSDISVKKNIRTIDNALERVIKSRGILYDRKDIDSKDNIGFIAQELEQQFPELISTNDDGTKGVKYQNAVAILFEAIKEQQKQIDNLKKQAA